RRRGPPSCYGFVVTFPGWRRERTMKFVESFPQQAGQSLRGQDDVLVLGVGTAEVQPELLCLGASIVVRIVLFVPEVEVPQRAGETAVVVADVEPVAARIVDLLDELRVDGRIESLYRNDQPLVRHVVLGRRALQFGIVRIALAQLKDRAEAAVRQPAGVFGPKR